ncbi:MAG TPA: BBP7 family outer membrane beta-barrel protein, partial [Lacipirellulaceae bacterium]|nr:BBP7 family outer membrane beta-barrel protein [Lacipirellulaceae bacterium]
MTNSTKLIGLIMTVTLWAGVAAAQAPALSSAGDDMPPDMQLPTPPTAGSSSMATTQPSYGSSNAAAQGSFPAAAVDGYDPNVDCGYGDAGGMWNQIAPIESTGTWLRRGFWYAETDAVVWNRIWNRNDKRFAAQDVNVNITPQANPDTGVGTSIGFNPIFLDTNRVLVVNGALPGEDAAVRATLGNFLFRDSRNRDHSVEFTAMGGGNWEQDRVLSSESAHGLNVPFFIDGANRSFDGSTRQELMYTSNLDSFELNYRVRARLNHDQLIMDPNGEWHRAANSGFTKDYIVGLRFMQMADRLDWRAQDIVNVGDDGSYNIRTANNLIGFQTGVGLTYQASRWSLGMRTKAGVFLNDASGTSTLDFTADDASDADLHLRENDLSFVGEFGIQSRFNITPNVSLRAGYDLMLMTSQAMAPNQ